jgi:predicted CXXCH cytochrome family protein
MEITGDSRDTYYDSAHEVMLRTCPSVESHAPAFCRSILCPDGFSVQKRTHWKGNALLKWIPKDGTRASEVVLMVKKRPATQFSIGAAPGKRPGLRVCWMILLGAAVFSAAALRAQAPAESSAPAKDAAASNFVGQETCATCHDEVSKKFEGNPHNKLALQHEGKGVTCEGCHGAGKAHVDGGGDVTKIFNPAKASTKEVDEKCLGCHAGTHPNFARSPHAKANVGCLSCHSVHAPGVQEKLLKAAQPTLCFQCHTDTKPAFDMPFHHKVNEGVVNCSDCHDVHGTFGNNNIRSTADQNAICTKCHT